MYNKRDHIVGACCSELANGFGSTVTYSCPCGKGSIIEEHVECPGYRNHSVDFVCEWCKDLYELDTTDGTYLWFLKERDGKKNG